LKKLGLSLGDSLTIVQERAFFLMRQFNVLQLLILSALFSVLLKEWLPNADDVIKAVKKVMYKYN
jgi:pyruvate dehydrogenase E1 component beta subunit